MQVKVIADSISQYGDRLTTMQLKFPRFILPEFSTHRVFSKNASSSRAIPVAKILEQVRADYAQPIHWGKNQPGMQASEELDQPAKVRVQSLWAEAAHAACDIAEKMMNEGVHKQVANRILESYQHIHVIASATEWDNFFALRDHPDAQPEIQHLARLMKQAKSDSKPQLLTAGQWHLPYVSAEERNQYPLDTLKMISAARCCRVSYLLHDGSNPSVEKDLELCMKLMKSRPIHASPFEHVATPHSGTVLGNFKGWRQLRHEL